MNKPMIYPAGLGTVFNFGKYKGRTVESVILEDPSYINWCMENVEKFSMNEDCKTLFSMQDWEDYIAPDFDDDCSEWGLQQEW